MFSQPLSVPPPVSDTHPFQDSLHYRLQDDEQHDDEYQGHDILHNKSVLRSTYRTGRKSHFSPTLPDESVQAESRRQTVPSLPAHHLCFLFPPFLFFWSGIEIFSAFPKAAGHNEPDMTGRILFQLREGRLFRSPFQRSCLVFV